LNGFSEVNLTLCDTIVLNLLYTLFPRSKCWSVSFTGCLWKGERGLKCRGECL